MAATVAVLFDNFGPYHFARVAAAARKLDVAAIELASQSSEYAWERTGEHGAVALHSLFPASGESTPEKPLIPAFAPGKKEPSVQPSARETSRRLATLLDQIDPAVVAVPGWATPLAYGALRWCVDRGRPAVVMSESTAGDTPRRAIQESVKRQIVGLFSGGLVGGKPQADYLASLGMPRERIFDGYDVVDNDYFADAKRRVIGVQASVIRKRVGLPENYFLASARFIEKKNLFRLIQAYGGYVRRCEREKGKAEAELRIADGELRSAISEVGRAEGELQNGTEPWHLVLLGDGELRSDLSCLIDELKLQEFVLMPGFKQYGELPNYYGLARCFIHASTSEQWGLVVNEAMASGLPVLVSNRCGCAPDLVVEGENGWSFDPYDVEQIAELMCRVTTMSDKQRVRMAQASSARIDDYSPDRFATGLADAVESARKVGPLRPTFLHKLLLNILCWRGAA